MHVVIGGDKQSGRAQFGMGLPLSTASARLGTDLSPDGTCFAPSGGMPQATVPPSVPFDSLTSALDTLARLEPSRLPMVSLYLNLEPDARGKDNYAAFVRKELQAAPESVERDVERIGQYLSGGVPPAANAVAIFACAARAEFFEALVLDVPVDRHRLTVAPEPHVLPLALLLDQHPRHAVVLADSHLARILVFGLGHRMAAHSVEGEKIRRSSGGGLAQNRFQRHVEKVQADHARALVQALDRIVREEKIDRIVLAGDEVNVPLVKSELSKELESKVVDVIRLESNAPEHVVMAAAGDALRRHDTRSDQEAVARLMDDYRAGGQAMAGLEKTAEAIARGQVAELFMTVPGGTGAPNEDAGNALVIAALGTSARVRFVEDAALLAAVGGVAARLRYASPTMEPGA